MSMPLRRLPSNTGMEPTPLRVERALHAFYPISMHNTPGWRPNKGVPRMALCGEQDQGDSYNSDVGSGWCGRGAIFEYAPATILVVLEATGTYWMTLATTLAQAGFAVSVIDSAQAHAFAKALLKRTKTDAIDAQTLAELAARLQPAP